MDFWYMCGFVEGPFWILCENVFSLFWWLSFFTLRTCLKIPFAICSKEWFSFLADLIGFSYFCWEILSFVGLQKSDSFRDRFC